MRQYHPPHLALAVASVAVMALVGAWVVAQRPSFAGPLVAVGIMALACQTAGLLAGWVTGAYVGVAVVGAAYAASQLGRHVQVAVPGAIGAGLLVSAELAWWSLDRAVGTTWPPGALGRRWAEIAMLAVAGFALALTAGMAGVWGLGRGEGVLVAGTVSALLLGLLLAGQARRAAK